MNIPNFLSMFRITLIPLFIICISYEKHIAALAVFLGAAVTDALDGFLARRFKQKTALGAYLDPIADKLLLVSSYIAFALLHLIPRWLTILVVSRDIIISMGILLLRLNAFHPEIRPSLISKCTTFFQIVTITAALLFHVAGGRIAHFADSASRGAALAALCWITGVCTVLSGMHYIFRGLKFINEKDSE